MDTHSARTALVSRCPGISDGAKVTMLEMLFHVDNGRFPSLNELRRIRNVARSTVQAHFSEWIEAGVLKRIVGAKNKVSPRVNDKQLLRLNGLKELNDVCKWLKNQAAAEAKNVGPKAVRSILKDPVNWNAVDAFQYFVMIGRRKAQTPEPLNPKARAQLTRMIRDFGGEIVHAGMDYFVANFRRMGMAYSPGNVRCACDRILRRTEQT